MDMNLLNALPDALKERFNQLEAVLNSPGWKAIVEDLQEQLETANTTINNASSWDNYTYARGFRDALLQTIEIDKRIEADFTAVAEEQVAEAEVVQESSWEDFQ